jgi:hypothetical protein
MDEQKDIFMPDCSGNHVCSFAFSCPRGIPRLQSISALEKPATIIGLQDLMTPPAETPLVVIMGDNVISISCSPSMPSLHRQQGIASPGYGKDPDKFEMNHDSRSCLLTGPDGYLMSNTGCCRKNTPQATSVT